MRLHHIRDREDNLDASVPHSDISNKNTSVDFQSLPNFPDIVMWRHQVAGAPLQDDAGLGYQMNDQTSQWSAQDNMQSSSGDPTTAFDGGINEDSFSSFFQDQSLLTHSGLAEHDNFYQQQTFYGYGPSHEDGGFQFVDPTETQRSVGLLSSGTPPPLTDASSPTGEIANLSTVDAAYGASNSLSLPEASLPSNMSASWTVEWPYQGNYTPYSAIPNTVAESSASHGCPVHQPRRISGQPYVATAKQNAVSATHLPIAAQPQATTSSISTKAAQASGGKQASVSSSLDAPKDMEQGRHGRLYSEAKVAADGHYHCPFRAEGKCTHDPTKLKCNYDKYIDSHTRPYRCKANGCEDQRFSSTACRLRHEREAHGSHGHGHKPYLCKYTDCERSKPGNGFPRSWNRNDHMKRVHDHNESSNASNSPKHSPMELPSSGNAVNHAARKRTNSSAEKTQQTSDKRQKTSAPQPQQQSMSDVGQQYFTGEYTDYYNNPVLMQQQMQDHEWQTQIRQFQATAQNVQYMKTPPMVLVNQLQNQVTTLSQTAQKWQQA